MALEIRIDRDVCMGSGNCSFSAPQVFGMDDESVSVVIDAGAASAEQIVRAARTCPTEAISVFEGGTRLV